MGNKQDGQQQRRDGEHAYVADNPDVAELHVAGVGESDLNLSVERLIDSLDDTQRPLLTPCSPGSSGI